MSTQTFTQTIVDNNVIKSKFNCKTRFKIIETLYINYFNSNYNNTQYANGSKRICAWCKGKKNQSVMVELQSS